MVEALVLVAGAAAAGITTGFAADFAISKAKKSD